MESKDAKQNSSGWQLSLSWALVLVIAITCVIVAFAYLLYWNNPNRKYDLARPGEKDNQSIKVDDEEIDIASPVDEKAVKNKIKFLENELKAINNVSSFNPDDLSDQRIQLSPSDRPSL